MNRNKLIRCSKERKLRIKDKNGYILIYAPNNPFSKSGYALEHRLIMESFIGRLLTENETVHHDDFNKQNNKIKNLTLFPTKSDHAHFHRQIKQFGMTQPRLAYLNNLKLKMLLERNKNGNTNILP